MHQIRTQNRAKQDDRPKEPGRNAHKSDSNYHKGMTLLSPFMCLYTPTLFPFNEHSDCFTHFRLKVEIHCYTAGRTGPCHWPLLPGGLVAKIQHSRRLGLTLISGWKPESCFTLLQAEATRDQFLFKGKSLSRV